jgi:hypothetical protein
MLRIPSYLAVAGCLVTPPVAAQRSAPDTVRELARLHREWITRHGAAIGAAIWPGYHPESIPTVYVIPGRAKLLVAWRETAPRGFQPLPGFANTFWTDTQTVSFPSGRFLAFLPVDSGSTAAEVLGLALHEEFHSFEHRSRREGRRFGGGENSMLTADYPVFDVDDEALWAIEGRYLYRALQAHDPAEARRLGQRFLAVRVRRQARLDSTMAEYEWMAELNEGLAQYAQLEGQLQLQSLDGPRWRAAGSRAVEAETGLLDSLLDLTSRSVRRRFYVTGSTMGLLLDRLAGPVWKRDLVAHDRAVQEAFARAVGYQGSAALGGAWADTLERLLVSTRPVAERAIARLRARRTGLVDSVLHASGLRLVVEAADLPGHHLNYCGFDPQNLLAVGDGRMLHARFVSLCAGDSVAAEFDQPVVEDRSRGSFQTVIADTTALAITAIGAPVVPPDSGAADFADFRLEAPGITLRAPHARVTRTGDEMRVALRP